MSVTGIASPRPVSPLTADVAPRPRQLVPWIPVTLSWWQCRSPERWRPIPQRLQCLFRCMPCRSGTLIALAADEIVLGEFSVLGPIDPQIAGLPAAAIVKARDSKFPDKLFELTLVLADVSEKALAQVKQGAVDLLTPDMEQE